MNFGKFLRKPFLQNPSGGCFYTYTLLGRLSLSRFNLAIQTLATAVSLGKEKKKSYPYFFFFCYRGSKLTLTIHHFSLIQQIIDEFLP